MPRIAKPIADNVRRVRNEFADYLKREGLSGNKFASAAGVGQPVISRFLSGRTKTITPALGRALTYARIAIDEDNLRIASTIDNQRLRAALEKHCDGSDELAEVFASLINAVGPVIRSMHQGTWRKKQ